jgi:hypothetical protein
MSNKILPFGYVTVTVAATESIAVYSRGVAKVYRELGYPNHPDEDSLLGEQNGAEVVYGAYASGATIRIEAGPEPAFYETGSAPVVMERRDIQVQGAPAAVNATATLTITDLLAGIITSTTAAAVTGTLPTGTLTDGGSEFAIGDSFDWSVINTGGANAFTVAAGTGHTIVGAAAVAASTSGRFRTRKTAANTFVTYRIG